MGVSVGGSVGAGVNVTATGVSISFARDVVATGKHETSIKDTTSIREIFVFI